MAGDGASLAVTIRLNAVSPVEIPISESDLRAVGIEPLGVVAVLLLVAEPFESVPNKTSIDVILSLVFEKRRKADGIFIVKRMTCAECRSIRVVYGLVICYKPDSSFR